MYRQMGDSKESIYNYDIVKQIGSGSFGVVYLVKNKESSSKNEYLVMKQISLAKLDPRQRLDAQKEILLLSTLSHPNIVSYRHSFENDVQQLHIIMDYCDGGDLYRKILDRKRIGVPFDEGQLVQWFIQICLALKYIHERKILHRDLKTQNIFACDEDNTVKVGDFGIARILDHTADLAATCIGTPYYLSPEVCQNRPYGTKTDVWALGCVLYELSTFSHPFEGRHLTELLTKIVRGIYEPLPPNYSHKFKQLISHMLKVNSSERPDVTGLLQKEYVYEHAAEFLQKFERHDELAFLEDLANQKREATEMLRRPSRPFVGGGSSVRRHTVASSTRSKLMSNSNRRAYFEKKFRMYMPPAGIRMPAKNRVRNGISSDDEGVRQLTPIMESHIPTDPVPPIVDVETDSPATADPNQEGISKIKVQIPQENPPEVIGFGATITKVKKRERRKWSGIKRSQPVLTPAISTGLQEQNDGISMSTNLTPTRTKILTVKAATPDPKRKSGSIGKVTGSMPSIPGAVDDGWSQDESHVCQSCGCQYVIGKQTKKSAAKTEKKCQACRLVKKRQNNILMENDSKSIFEKIECLRSELEKSLGMETFTKIYQNSMKSDNSSRFQRIGESDRSKFETLLFFEKAYLN